MVVRVIEKYASRVRRHKRLGVVFQLVVREGTLGKDLKAVQRGSGPCGHQSKGVQRREQHGRDLKVSWAEQGAKKWEVPVDRSGRVL